MTMTQIKTMSSEELDRSIGFGNWVSKKMKSESVNKDLMRLKDELKRRQNVVAWSRQKAS